MTNRTRSLFRMLFLALASLVAPEIAEAQTPGPPPDDDNQVWHETQVFIALDEKKRTDLVLLQYARFGWNEGFRRDLRSGAGVRYNINKYWSVQPTYVYQYAEQSDGRKSYSHRLFVDNSVRIPFSKFSLPNRVRVERLVRHSRPDAWNFRFRPGIDVPVTIGGEKMTLFANTEVFYDTGPKAWTRNRVMAGVSKKFNDVFTCDFFYLHQNDGFGTTSDVQAFGTILKVRLR